MKKLAYIVILASIHFEAASLAFGEQMTVSDPLSVCFSEILPTVLRTSDSTDKKTASLLASDIYAMQANQQDVDVAVHYTAAGGNVNVSNSNQYVNQVKTLNDQHYSNQELHNYVQESLSPQAIQALEHCMDTKAAMQAGTITVWPRINSTGKDILVHVQSVPGGGVVETAVSMRLITKDGVVCDDCGSEKKYPLVGSAAKIFAATRTDRKTPFIAIVSANNVDHEVLVEPDRELKFVLPQSTNSCSGDMAQIIQLIGPTFQDSPSRYNQSGHFVPATFPIAIGSGFTGLGWLVEPSTPPFDNASSNVVLDDQKMTSVYVPDPNRATVVYEFTKPARIKQLEIVQHGNGINALHAYLGDGPDSFPLDLGEAKSNFPSAPSGATIPEGQNDVFVLPSSLIEPQGRFLKVTITHTVLPTGWATYRIFPRDALGRRFLPAMICNNGYPM